MIDHGATSPAHLGRTLKLFLVDGSPLGVITAELGVSSVRAVVSPRTALAQLIKRPEAKRTGVYLLLGPDLTSPDRQLVYIGEGDQVGPRLIKHDSDKTKEFFTRAVLIVSKDENLTKAHGRYIESRLIEFVRKAKRAKLVNGTEPLFKGLPEPEIADMERVMNEIAVLLPLLGFDILRPAGQGVGAVSVQSAEAAVGPFSLTGTIQLFVFKQAGIEASGREADGEFVVLAGSRARRQEVDSCAVWIKRGREKMIADGQLEVTPDGKFLEFVMDTAFSSPSAAAAAVYGGNVSGQKHWKDAATGKSYAEWRKLQLGGSDATPVTRAA